MKRLIIKALSLTVVLITLLSVIILPASAVTAPVINPMLDTYVLDDLDKMGYNINDFPFDPSATHLQVIHFLEYGYRPIDYRYYGLYIYLYNPCGKAIQADGSYLQLCYVADGEETKYVKYPLEVMSFSEDAGNEHVFYKLRVKGTNDIPSFIDSSERVYKLGSIEILYEGETKAKTKTLRDGSGLRECTWRYQGYQANFSSDSDAHTLTYYVEELDTIPVELHDASWMSDTSNLGEDYRWEVKSFYFNIPKSYIEKYGDIDAENGGLISVEGEYYKYGLNGLIVPDQEMYDLFKQTENSYILSENYVDHWGSFYIPNYEAADYITWNEPLVSLGWNFAYSKAEDVSYSDDYFNLIRYCLLFQNSSSYISPSELKEHWLSMGKPLIPNIRYNQHMYMGQYVHFEDNRVPFEVTVNDGDLGNALKTYSTRKEWGSFNWLHQWFNKKLYTDKEGYSDCYPLIQIQPGDINDFQEEAYLGSNLYLNYDSYLGLKSFYEEKADKNSIYLMRLGVEPYFNSEVFLSNEKGVGTASHKKGSYFEKIIYTDCDIFAFTFKNEDGGIQRVPVDCDPVDNLGLIVSGNNKVDSNPNQYPKDPSLFEIIDDGLDKTADFLGSLKGIVILVACSIGLLLIAILIIVFWKHLEPLFIGVGKFLGAVFTGIARFFGKLGRSIGAVFGFIGKFFFAGIKAIWNIGMTVLFYFTGLDLRIKGGLDFSSGSSKSHDTYDREDRELRRNEDRRREERHQAQMKVLESKSQKNNDTNNKE